MPPPKQPVKTNPGDEILGASRQASGMWSDTMRLFGSILTDLPSGPLGAIMKTCMITLVLLALVLVVSLVTIGRATPVLAIAGIMFLFFIVIVALYLKLPPPEIQRAIDIRDAYSRLAMAAQLPGKKTSASAIRNLRAILVTIGNIPSENASVEELLRAFGQAMDKAVSDDKKLSALTSAIRAADLSELSGDQR
jgi:hypothetical protein